MRPVFPTHISTPKGLCVCCGKKSDCIGKKRRKFYRLVEAVKREEAKRAKGGPPNAGLVAAMSADANILQREIERIVRMEQERDEVQS